MAFIASKLVRAALASRPIGDTAGGISPCLPRLYLTGDSIRRMSAAAGNPRQPFRNFDLSLECQNSHVILIALFAIGSESRIPKEFSLLG